MAKFYWIVCRALKSGGSVSVALGKDGPYYCKHGYEMRFAEAGSADAFRGYAEGHLSILEGQTGPLACKHVVRAEGA